MLVGEEGEGRHHPGGRQQVFKQHVMDMLGTLKAGWLHETANFEHLKM